MGRPLQSVETLRDIRVDCYLNSQEREHLASKAVEAGLALSVFLRRSALAQKVVALPIGNVEKWRDLASLASNLNQCISHINAGKLPHLPNVLVEDLAEAVRQLRLGLLGATP
jgi:hypothetical protein